MTGNGDSIDKMDGITGNISTKNHKYPINPKYPWVDLPTFFDLIKKVLCKFLKLLIRYLKKNKNIGYVVLLTDAPSVLYLGDRRIAPRHLSNIYKTFIKHQYAEDV